ncbi:MAG: class I SAM-dependent methyltransferase [Chitinispirillaceae bacterium]|jgi:SAM-dependent methyltransferase
MSAPKNKPDYGFDGSPLSLIILNVAIWGMGVLLINVPAKFLKVVACFLFFCGFLLGILSALWVFYVKVGKFHRRDQLLSMIDWKGNEIVLDIGTGRGLLMIGAAQKLTSGKSIGIDIWRQKDMHNNNSQSTLRNAELEGVLEKIELRNENAQKLPFSNNFFDVVFSNLCLHNIPSKEGREKACREISRVLKPTGIAVICDVPLHSKEYCEVFKNEGLKVDIMRLNFDGFPHNRIVKAIKR